MIDSKRQQQFILLLIISMLAIGCIGQAQSDYSLKYGTSEGDQFIYGCTYNSSEMDGILPINISVVILDVDDGKIRSNITSVKEVDGKVVRTSFDTITDVQGRLLATVPENGLIPEAQPEFPNLLIYPEGNVQEGDSWEVPFENDLDGSHVSGQKNYTVIGQKTISTNAGSFECLEIESETTYVGTSITEAGNETIDITVTGQISGKDWIDVNEGFLVKSNYVAHNIMTTNFSAIYQGLGLHNVYQDVPVSFQFDTELEDVK